MLLCRRLGYTDDHIHGTMQTLTLNGTTPFFWKSSWARVSCIKSQDVDAMPMRGLHEVVSRPPVYVRLLEMCRGGRPPTHAAPAFPAASCSGADTEAATLDTRPPTFLVVPALEFVGASSPDDPRIRALLQEAGNKRKAADLVVAGDLQAFHAACFPEGHRQTNLDRWTTLPVDATPYEVKNK